MPHPHFSAHFPGVGKRANYCLCSSIVKDHRHAKPRGLQKKIAGPMHALRLARRCGLAQDKADGLGGRTWTRTRDFILIRDAL